MALVVELALRERISWGPVGLCWVGHGLVIDPRGAAPRALFTHAHADHAPPGCQEAFGTPETQALYALREPEATLHAGYAFEIDGVTWSSRPAGHMWGSVQWGATLDGMHIVVAGDVKRDADPTCAPLEDGPADGLVIEATFALPVFDWPDPQRAFDALAAWASAAQARGETPVIIAYASGKSQRVLAELAKRMPGPFAAHGAIARRAEVYRAHGVALPPLVELDATDPNPVVLAPPGAEGSAWVKRLRRPKWAEVSGHLAIRGVRRRRNLDHACVVSDHADFDALLGIVKASGASEVLAVGPHGPAFARYLRESLGLRAEGVVPA